MTVARDWLSTTRDPGTAITLACRSYAGSLYVELKLAQTRDPRRRDHPGPSSRTTPGTIDLNHLAAVAAKGEGRLADQRRILRGYRPVALAKRACVRRTQAAHARRPSAGKGKCRPGKGCNARHRCGQKREWQRLVTRPPAADESAH